MVQHADWTFTLDQSHYCDTVEPVPLGRERRAQMERGLSKEELSQCRSVIGALLCLVVHSVITLLQGKLPTATGHFLVELNKLVETAKHAAATPLRIYSYKNICFVCWSDASWGVRPDGSSQGGFLLGACEADFCRGDAGKVNYLCFLDVESSQATCSQQHCCRSPGRQQRRRGIGVHGAGTSSATQTLT